MVSERKLLAQGEARFQLLAPATHRFQAELANSAVNLGHPEETRFVGSPPQSETCSSPCCQGRTTVHKNCTKMASRLRDNGD